MVHTATWLIIETCEIVSADVSMICFISALQPSELTRDLLLEVKQLGFSDRQIARAVGRWCFIFIYVVFSFRFQHADGNDSFCKHVDDCIIIIT